MRGIIQRRPRGSKDSILGLCGFLPSASLHSFPTLGSVRVLWLMHGFVHDLSSIHSLALSPFGCLLYADPGLWRKWGPREEWEGSLLSWAIQSRQ